MVDFAFGIFNLYLAYKMSGPGEVWWPIVLGMCSGASFTHAFRDFQDGYKEFLEKKDQPE